MNVHKITQNFIIAMVLLLIAFIPSSVLAQYDGPHEYKWVRIGQLHSWFSNSGNEIEYGRRTRSHLEDQTDGMRWPAQFTFQDHSAAKAVWIGTTNYTDPMNNEVYPYKVICNGPRSADMLHDFMPVDFKMIGRFSHPAVTVDNTSGSQNDIDDIVDEYADIPCDRLIYNKLNTSIGITMTRTVRAFSQQYNDNYYIYEYVFKNTGIIDDENTQVSRTLTDVIFDFQYRYAFGFEGFRDNWGLPGNISWGKNCVNHVIGQDPTVQYPKFQDLDFHIRAIYAWYGPHSDGGVYEEQWGAPHPTAGNMLAAPAEIGAVVLHADESATEKADDPAQPTTTLYLGSDNDAKQYDAYNTDGMSQMYALMSAGHPSSTHAEDLGNNFADDYKDDPGGYESQQGFGPYDLAYGDSVRIVIAEAVGGLDRVKNMEVASNWFNDRAPFTYPDPVPNLPSWMTPINADPSDRNEYKKAWVWTAEDSLFQAFRRAVDCYNNNYIIPQPPLPPTTFTVSSGGDRITLEWNNNAESEPNFDGYRIYRAVGQPDTLYQLIFECDANNVVNVFEDKTARRGFDYYYYIVSKDNGSTNTVQPGVPLVSSMFYTMTNVPAYLRRPAESDLSEIRIVPNPFHLRASELQFGITTPDRIAFFGLPPKCSIKILTERGDLIKSISHTDGSGDELWDCITSSRQIVVSGLYIAYFEVTENVIDEITGDTIFKKGDNTFRKFIVIR